MSVFVVSRSNVGFFGYISSEKIVLLPTDGKNYSSASSPSNFQTVSCDDKFAVTLELESDDKKTDNVENAVLCGGISNCGNYLAACDVKKKFYLWKKVDNAWVGSSSRTLARKGYKILFTNSGNQVLLVDRAGDMFSFPVNQNSDPGKLILGHICLILDAAITKNDRYIITCDRDCKIRVSLYPNCYNILTYCLGHDEFVSSLQLIGIFGESLLSASGDGTMRVWKYEEGKEILSYNVLKSRFKSASDSTSCCTVTDITSTCEIWKGKFAIRMLRYSLTHEVVAALFHPQPAIGIYKVSADLENVLQPIQLLNCHSMPFDAYFDQCCNLWVYKVCESNSVTMFRCETGNGLSFVEVSNPEECLVAELNKNWPHKIIETVEVDMRYLYKATAEDWAERKSGKSAKKPKLEVDGIKA